MSIRLYCSSQPVTPHYARRRHSAAGAGRPPRPHWRQRDQLPPVRGAGGGRGGLGPGRRRDGLHRGGGHQDLHRGGPPSLPVRKPHGEVAAGHHRGRHAQNCINITYFLMKVFTAALKKTLFTVRW